MGLSSALYASISGLSTMGNAMSVLGDNVSNVNTVAFKSSRSTFQDVLSQSVSTASGSKQVGRGVTLSTVNGLFAQGSFESSSSATDMAIGGQGFFMLRAGDTSVADKYSRGGEFGFDLEGNLVNPMGYFVQGWDLSGEGDRMGTIGDLNIGKSTPPVTTQTVELIANLDSRADEENNEERLFESWNALNVAATPPSAPIDSTRYEYTSSIKVYDAQGAAHDLSIYFDKTTKENEWEFMVTCDPTEDKRNLTLNEQQMFEPYETYDYTVHRGAGALMYGVIGFTTSGEFDTLDAWQVPPDGQVDPALNENRIVLSVEDSYYEFDANFTGEPIDYTTNPPLINPTVRLNLGAVYGAQTSTQPQVLVSDAGGLSDTLTGAAVNSSTQWQSVYDQAGNVMQTGDQFIFEGFDHNGVRVTPLVYEVVGTNTVQDLLDDIHSLFGVNAELDSAGRLRLTDATQGDSALGITNFYTISGNQSVPFGGGLETVATFFMPNEGVTSPAGGSVASLTTPLAAVWDRQSTPAVIDALDDLVFTDAISATTLTFNAGANTIADLLLALETAFGGSPAVTGTIDSDGRIRLIDNTPGAADFDISASIVDNSGNGARPWGFDVAPANMMQQAFRGNINITSSKQTITSIERGLSTSSGNVPVITAQTPWSSVYDEATLGGSGNASEIVANTTIDFDGQFGEVGGTITTIVGGAGNNGRFTVQDAGVPLFWSATAGIATGTVEDLLDWVEYTFQAEARIDEAGRLTLTDWVADTSTRESALAINGITTLDEFGVAGVIAEPFGGATEAFEVHPADVGTEDGSQMGDTISNRFRPEALSTTQYANSSTTIFQDQDGFSSGFLQSVSVDTNGIITGHYSNGQVLEKVQVALANFSNLHGLFKAGGNIFTETTDSGAPTTGAPGDNGLGSIAPNALEMSNVDLGSEFVKLITTQRGFQANSKIITTTDEMLNDLINIKR